MSPPTNSPAVPSDARAVADRYLRRERLLSGTMAISVGLLGAVAVLLLPLLRALGVVVLLLVVFRFPVFRTAGTATLSTEAEPAAVRAAFAGPTPPVLPFQWGIADTVRTIDGGAAYDVSYLFGLRSVTMTVETAVTGEDTLELVVTAGEQDWATYDVTIHETEDGTTVDVEWSADRRFALRRLPQTLLAGRYREQALAAQGYTTVEWDTSLSL
ncbi:hypothetical protein [Haloarcula halophila]|uniref:hypothetical protein n=1 Tax=Haloarcula TaxID=2237 RepID=UPI0023E41C8E|nr:hypothetical protein [Halomicroarcula sp. DFY41]